MIKKKYNKILMDPKSKNSLLVDLGSSSDKIEELHDDQGNKKKPKH